MVPKLSLALDLVIPGLSSVGPQTDALETTLASLFRG
jgi:hypothetical protein